MKRKLIALLLSGAMVTVSLTGCSACAGNESAATVETKTDVGRIEEEPVVENDHTEEERIGENTPENDKPETISEKDGKGKASKSTTVSKTADAKKADSKKVDAKKKVVPKNTSKKTTKKTTKKTAKKTTKNSSKASKKVTPKNTAPKKTTPKHTHKWMAHKTTKKVWVPKKVTVVDYEWKTAHPADYVCNCGKRFYGKEGRSEHSKAHILAGEPSNHWTEPCIHKTKVKTGSHTEDHGHYQTKTIIDYYYCACGKRK